jgi:hypothetical protein
MTKGNSRIRVSHKKRRGPGRPLEPHAARKVVPVRLSEQAFETLDRWATSENIKRSEAIRRLVEDGLAKLAPAKRGTAGL